MSRVSSQTVLRYLERQRNWCWTHAEVWEGDDYAVAFLIVLYATRDTPAPVRQAFLDYYAVPPEQLQARILERRRTLLGPVEWARAYPEPKPAMSYPKALAKKQSA